MKILYCSTLLIISSLMFVSCSSKPADNIVDVTAKDYYFTATDSISSGWTTFRFKNEGQAVHFFFLTLLPDSITFERYLQETLPPFTTAMDSLKADASKADAGALLVSLLPKWYFSSKILGGTGLTSPGKTSQTTLKLQPGTYSMECYFKTQDGTFHSKLGMMRPLIVTKEVSKMKEPANADVKLTLSNFKIESKGEPDEGTNTIAVHFKEHPKYGLGNDIQLVKLKDNTNLGNLIQWMNWMNINGFCSPTPPAEFLGGTQEMPVGYTAYFKVNLEPGNYVWISEFTADRGMVKQFSIE